MGGVLPGYRGMGIATELARRQLRTVAGMGYTTVGYYTKHDNVPMLRMALGLGFDIVGLQFKPREKIALVILEREIGAPERF
jgi:ribosomal protein S18 acetylase RimI-like enzyme